MCVRIYVCVCMVMDSAIGNVGMSALLMCY
jgi:hypothetical protein